LDRIESKAISEKGRKERSSTDFRVIFIRQKRILKQSSSRTAQK
jgi:hypothetical protein